MTISLGRAAKVSRAELRLCEQAQAIDQANAEFAKKDPAEQRVAIAEDVLKWLAEGKIKPKQQYYFIPGDGVDTTVNGGTCQACALGAIFACSVERGKAGGSLLDEDGYRIGTGNRMRDKLAGFFDEKQLALIEVAFEQGSGVRSLDLITGQADFFAASRMYLGLDARARMQAIMQNIIANKGTFVLAVPSVPA